MRAVLSPIRGRLSTCGVPWVRPAASTTRTAWDDRWGLPVYRTVLVMLDGSLLAERALPAALALARPLEARLVLVRAAAAELLLGLELPLEPRRPAAEARAYLARVTADLARRGFVAETVVPLGSPAQAILQEAKRQEADLLVMATHGRGGLGRWVYGSVAEEVLARTSAPLLLVQAWQNADLLERLTRRPRLLLALDRSSQAEEALPVARGLQQVLDGVLIYLHVVAEADQTSLDLPFVHLPRRGREAEPVSRSLQERLEEARNWLAAVAGRTAVERGTCVLDVRAGDPAREIPRAALEHDVALVVMATHGASALQRLLFGDVPGAVLRAASAPVLFVRPAGPKLAGAELALRAT